MPMQMTDADWEIALRCQKTKANFQATVSIAAAFIRPKSVQTA